MLDRGQDYAVYQTVQAFTDTGGRTWYQTNQFTLLENALHYLDNGQWKESRDVIEPFPDGAVARYGPHRAIFSADSSYIYYCWGDNRTRRSGRLQADARFKRIPW